MSSLPRVAPVPPQVLTMGETTTGAAYRPAQEAPIGACFNNNSFAREEVADMTPHKRELFA